MNAKLSRRQLLASSGGVMMSWVVSGADVGAQSPLFITPTSEVHAQSQVVPTSPPDSVTNTDGGGTYTSPIGSVVVDWGTDFSPVSTSFNPVPGEIDYLALDWDFKVGKILSGIRVIIDITLASGPLDADAILAGFPPDLPEASWGYAPGTKLLAGSARGNAICLTFGGGPGTMIPGTMGVYSISLPPNQGEPVIGAMIGMNWGTTASLENLARVASQIQINDQSILGPFPADLVWQSLASLGAELDAVG